CSCFQAEDGIRDRNVTGVQTCALPISTPVHASWESTHATCTPCRCTAAYSPTSHRRCPVVWCAWPNRESAARTTCSTTPVPVPMRYWWVKPWSPKEPRGPRWRTWSPPEPTQRCGRCAADDPPQRQRRHAAE